MKKFFYSVLAAATMLFATTSCSQDDEIVGGGTVDNGTTQKVTFTVQMPDEGVASRAIADGVNVGGGNKADNLIWALYEKGKDNVRLDFGHVTGEKNTETGKHEFTADISVVKGLEYNILFFAYDDEKCVFQLNTEDPDLTALTLIPNLVANEEGYDAFVKCHPYKTGGETTVELKRPFAQINAATTDDDLTRAAKLQAVVTKSELVIKDVPTQYNVLTEEATENKVLIYKATPILTHYPTVTEGHPNEDITVDKVGYKYLAMAYVLAGATKESEESMHEATFNFYRGTNGDDLMRTIDIPSLPIQRNHRTNVIGDLLTETESFKIVIDEKFDEPDHNIIEGTIATVTIGLELETALRQDLETIIVNLGEEVTGRAESEPIEFEVNMSAWVEPYYFGTAKTKTIIINGNGHTINFVHNNSDWNYIRCHNEDAKWFINNAHLKNSGYNNGPWNRHDISFYNAVELQDVTSEVAIAVLNDATLKNVTISDARASDDYGLWITAEGQTVELDRCTFNMVKDNNATGRGIKIADEYVDSPALVTLNVKNTTFQTEKKAAVLVTSKAGADITWGEGNDISGVAADQTYAVWVDEDYADYYDLVTVTGCMKWLEGDTFIADGLVKGKNGAYKVSNANGLVELSKQTIAASESVILTADIDLEGVEFGGLYAFNAENNNTFDGGNHIISNWTYNGGASDMGFIKQWVGPIKNIKFENYHLKTGGRSAVVAGKVYGNIDNVTVNNCSIEDTYWVCGIIAGLYNSGSISNCTVTNSSVKSNGGTGGIVGVINETPGERNLTKCSVSGTTINNVGSFGASYSGGGLIGMFNPDGDLSFTIEGCTVAENKLEGKYIFEKYPNDDCVTEK